MADTNHAHEAIPVEGDGISYRGIVWFMIVLAITTVFCQVLVWGMMRVMAHESRIADEARPSGPYSLNTPQITDGHLTGGDEDDVPMQPPAPLLSVSEPTILSDFRTQEDQLLTTYGWMDKSNQVVRIPVERAKALILERGLPARTASGAAAAPAGATARPAAAKGTK